MRFTYALKAAATGGSPAQIYLRANDLSDPRGSAGSGSPQGFTEWMAIYKCFRVIQTTCLATLCNESLYTAHAVLSAATESTGALTVEEAMMNPFQVNSVLPMSTSNSKVILVRTLSTCQVLGISPSAIRSENDLSGLVSTAPTTLWYYLLTI
jgi:hypothetical protein